MKRRLFATSARIWTGRLLLVTVASLVTVFSAEIGLAILGYPAEHPERVAHPPGFTELRERLEFRYSFRTNGQGLRYRELPMEKQSGRARVFVAGDSFTEGDGVSDSERFTDQLEAAFQDRHGGVDFINGGLSAAGPIEYGNLFVKVGQNYSPDALLICFFVNDVSNTGESLFRVPFAKDPPRGRSRIRRRIHQILPRINTQIEILQDRATVADGQNVKRGFVEAVTSVAESRGIDQRRIAEWEMSVPQDLADAVDRGHFNGSVLSQGLLNPNYWVDSLELNSESSQRRWTTCQQILSALVDHCRADHVEAAIVFLPVSFQYDPSAYSNENPYVFTGCHLRQSWLTDETPLQQSLEAWAASAEIPFLDLTPDFRNAIHSSRSLYWKLDGHWTPEGHTTAARAIESWLSTGNVFHCIPASRLPSGSTSDDTTVH